MVGITARRLALGLPPVRSSARRPRVPITDTTTATDRAITATTTAMPTRRRPAITGRATIAATAAATATAAFRRDRATTRLATPTTRRRLTMRKGGPLRVRPFRFVTA